jgi:hypothetical protein
MAGCAWAGGWVGEGPSELISTLLCCGNLTGVCARMNILAQCCDGCLPTMCLLSDEVSWQCSSITQQDPKLFSYVPVLLYYAGGCAAAASTAQQLAVAPLCQHAAMWHSRRRLRDMA